MTARGLSRCRNFPAFVRVFSLATEGVHLIFNDHASSYSVRQLVRPLRVGAVSRTAPNTSRAHEAPEQEHGPHMQARVATVLNVGTAG
jgi:hypothetical protein